MASVIIDSTEELLKQASELADRAESLAVKLVGMEPPIPCKIDDAPRGVAGSFLEDVDVRLSSLRRVLGRVRDHVDRAAKELT